MHLQDLKRLKELDKLKKKSDGLLTKWIRGNFIFRSISGFYQYYISSKLKFIRTEAKLLLKSRIFQFLITIPCLYFMLKIGMYAKKKYDDKFGGNSQVVNNRGQVVYRGQIATYGYSEDHPNRKFLTSSSSVSYWDRFRLYVAYVIHELLTDTSIYGEGLSFLDYLFRHDQTHEAGVFLLTQVLQDQRFIDEANLFGENLISWVLLQP